MQRDLGPGGLGGALLVALVSLFVGYLAHFVFHAPGLTVAATLIVAVEALGGRMRVVEDQVAARLALVGLAFFVCLLAAASLRAPAGVHFVGLFPGLGLALAITMVLSSIAASGFVEKLTTTGPALRAAAVLSTVVACALVATCGSRACAGWMAGALLGVFVALVALARSSEHHRALAQLSGAVQATREGDGWLSFEDGTAPLRAPELDGRGPVAVVIGASRQGSAYRDDDVRSVVAAAPGALERIRHQLRLEAARQDALALGAVAMMASPLAAAAWFALRPG